MDFEELNRRLSPTIKRIAYKLNGRYRCFSHDDLYQEACLHLWNNFRSDKLNDKTDSYILQGCYFHLRNYIRKVNEKANTVSIDAALNGEEGSVYEDILAADAFKADDDCRLTLDTRLMAERIQNEAFNRREKTVLSFLAEGLTTRDIGRKIGVSHVSVVKIISGIRKKCRKYADEDQKF